MEGGWMMDYSALARDMIKKLYMLHRATPQRNIDEALQGEAHVLYYMADRGVDVLPGEISNYMNVSSARIAQALNSIESKGWITRKIDKNDRRRILVRLTQEGKKAAESYQQNIQKLVSKMLNLLGEHDSQEYVRITGKLAEAIGANKDLLSE